MNVWLALLLPDPFSIEPEIYEREQCKGVNESRDRERYVVTSSFAEG